MVRGRKSKGGARVAVSEPKRRLFRVVEAARMGMCFGVRDALEAVREAARQGPLTVLGELAHNEVVLERLAAAGIGRARPEADSAPTQRVAITAHGVSDQVRRRWLEAGYEVTDTTCPLVRKAHDALACLVAEGCHPVVIGRHGHVEVQGLTGDYPEAVVIEDVGDIARLPKAAKLGVVSQTTQPPDRVAVLLGAIRRERPGSIVDFRDTVCRPTRERQQALEALCREADFVVVVGGKNSNNTRELVEKIRAYGVPAHRVARPQEVRREWLKGCRVVGVTAGTSTLPESVAAVTHQLRQWAGE